MSTKRRTAADVAAAVALGAIDPDAEVLTDAEARSIAAESARSNDARRAVGMNVLPDDGSHHCTIPGCTHGAAHGGPKQPDRQVKIECLTCGAVARMTASALARAGGFPTCADGTLMSAAARRTYSRKAS